MPRGILIYLDDDIFDTDDIELVNDIGTASSSDALPDGSLAAPDFQAAVLVCLGMMVGCLLFSSWRFR